MRVLCVEECACAGTAARRRGERRLLAETKRRSCAAALGAAHVCVWGGGAAKRRAWTLLAPGRLQLFIHGGDSEAETHAAPGVQRPAAPPPCTAAGGSLQGEALGRNESVLTNMHSGWFGHGAAFMTRTGQEVVQPPRETGRGCGLAEYRWRRREAQSAAVLAVHLPRKLLHSCAVLRRCPATTAQPGRALERALIHHTSNNQ